MILFTKWLTDNLNWYTLGWISVNKNCAWTDINSTCIDTKQNTYLVISKDTCSTWYIKNILPWKSDWQNWCFKIDVAKNLYDENRWNFFSVDLLWKWGVWVTSDWNTMYMLNNFGEEWK